MNERRNLLTNMQVMASIVTVLIFIHRRNRYARYQELQEYYNEQMRLAF